jgi:hypothetical protein
LLRKLDFEVYFDFEEAIMLKRIALSMALVATFVVAGFSFANTAEAWRYRSSGYWGRPYASYYYGPRAYNYGLYAPYRTYYGPGVYGPRVVARPYYNAYRGPAIYYGPIYR